MGSSEAANYLFGPINPNPFGSPAARDVRLTGEAAGQKKSWAPRCSSHWNHAQLQLPSARLRPRPAARVSTWRLSLVPGSRIHPRWRDWELLLQAELHPFLVHESGIPRGERQCKKPLKLPPLLFLPRTCQGPSSLRRHHAALRHCPSAESRTEEVPGIPRQHLDTGR